MLRYRAFEQNKDDKLSSRLCSTAVAHDMLKQKHINLLFIECN